LEREIGEILAYEKNKGACHFWKCLEREIGEILALKKLNGGGNRGRYYL
jgi:hypothetical protein